MARPDQIDSISIFLATLSTESRENGKREARGGGRNPSCGRAAGAPQAPERRRAVHLLARTEGSGELQGGASGDRWLQAAGKLDLGLWAVAGGAEAESRLEETAAAGAHLLVMRCETTSSDRRTSVPVVWMAFCWSSSEMGMH